jgi:hypothetical protein
MSNGARPYNTEQQDAILHQLGIKSRRGKVTGKEAAVILTWRAREEQGIERTYDPASLRQHVREGNIVADTTNPRMSRYPVVQVFELPIRPRRGRTRGTPLRESAQVYTPQQRRAILRQLGIKPEHGTVTGKEAARILTWRAKEEEDVEHFYDPASLRRHVYEGTIEADTSNPRMNRYPVEKVFELPIAPRRGRARVTSPQEAKQPSS